MIPHGCIILKRLSLPIKNPEKFGVVCGKNEKDRISPNIGLNEVLSERKVQITIYSCDYFILLT